MARAVEKGYGVGIVPRYLVRKHLESGHLVTLPFSNSLSYDSFRFILRNDPVLEHNLALLAKHMQQIGLR